MRCLGFGGTAVNVIWWKIILVHMIHHIPWFVCVCVVCVCVCVVCGVCVCVCVCV